MKVALIGATGFVGAPVLAELLSRGHVVTVLARNPGKLTPQPGLTVIAADALDAAQVAAAVAGHDAVVSEYKQGALAAREALNQLKGETSLDWVFLSPPIGLAPGARTGQYRLGLDDLLPGVGEAPAGISVADLAVAIVDEIETRRHVQQRFTVAN